MANRLFDRFGYIPTVVVVVDTKEGIAANRTDYSWRVRSLIEIPDGIWCSMIQNVMSLEGVTLKFNPRLTVDYQIANLTTNVVFGVLYGMSVDQVKHYTNSPYKSIPLSFNVSRNSQFKGHADATAWARRHIEIHKRQAFFVLNSPTVNWGPMCCETKREFIAPTGSLRAVRRLYRQTSLV